MPGLPAVLRDEPQFRLLFLGQALSVLGDRMMLVVLPFAVLSTGGGTADVGLVVAAQTVPFLLFALSAGVIADRIDRKRVLIASDLVRMAVQLTAAALLLGGTAEPWHLAVLAFAFGTGDAFFMPAMTGLLPMTVSEPHQLQPANALRGLSYHVGSIGGPVIAAVLLAVAGPGEAVLLDAATFAVSVAALARLRPRAVPVADADAPSGAFLEDLRGGWREVRTRPWVQGFLGALAIYHVVVLPSVYVLGPVLAEDEMGGATAWAAISIAFGVGSIVGDGLLLRFRPRHALRISALALALGSCQAIVFGSGLPVVVICGLEVVAAVGVAASFTLWEATLQEHIPSHAISRVSSYDYLATGGLMPVGMAVAGPVAAAVGIHTTLAVMSGVGIAAALACLTLPSVRDLPRAGAPATA